MGLRNIEHWDEFLPPQPPEGPNFEPYVPLDRTAVSEAAMDGQQWHMNMLALTGSWVAKGLNDAEIQKLSASHTLPGYSYEQTQAEIQLMIDGARAKGFDSANTLPNSQTPDSRGLHPHFDFIADIELTPPEWIVDEIITANTLTAIVGASYAGKSLAAIDLCCCIAAGIDFHGQPVKQGSVVYIAAEGRSGLLSRVDAWRAANGKDEAVLPFILSKTGLNMRDPALIASIKTLIDTVSDLRLIVIDTLNRNYGGGNENESSDMGQFITSCDELIDHFNCTVCVVHHMGKDHSAGARGHSSFYAALDTEITVKAIGDNDVQMACTKQKDAPEFETMQFIKMPTLNSVVLEPVAVTRRNDRAKLSDIQQIAMDAFFEGIEPKLATGTPKKSCRLHLEDWRKIFHRRHSGDNYKSKNDVFARARNSLQNKRLINCDCDYFTLGDKATGGDFG
jgi:hypothetical protein